MILRLALPALLALLVGILWNDNLVLKRENLNLAEQIKGATQEISTLRSKLSDEKVTLASPEILRKSSSALANPDTSDSFGLKKNRSKNRPVAKLNEVATISELASLQKFVSLGAHERGQIQEIFADRSLTGEQVDDQLRAVLGNERFDQYQNAENEFQDRLAREQVDQEVFTLARKLKLEPGQEDRIREIISFGKSLFKSKDRRGARDLATKDSILNALKLEKERQNYNAEKLKSVLNDTQYNAYLELQASSPAGISHDSFMQVAQPQENDPVK